LVAIDGPLYNNGNIHNSVTYIVTKTCHADLCPDMPGTKKIGNYDVLS
jgi:hypothetical protein